MHLFLFCLETSEIKA